MLYYIVCRRSGIDLEAPTEQVAPEHGTLERFLLYQWCAVYNYKCCQMQVDDKTLGDGRASNNESLPLDANGYTPLFLIKLNYIIHRFCNTGNVSQNRRIIVCILNKTIEYGWAMKRHHHQPELRFVTQSCMRSEIAHNQDKPLLIRPWQYTPSCGQTQSQSGLGGSWQTCPCQSFHDHFPSSVYYPHRRLRQMAQSSLGPQWLTIKISPFWSCPGSTHLDVAKLKVKVD